MNTWKCILFYEISDLNNLSPLDYSEQIKPNSPSEYFFIATDKRPLIITILNILINKERE